MNVVIDGLVVNYRDIGNKNEKPILFLHGWGDDSSSFNDLTDSLKGKYRCVVLDLPGFGGTAKPKTPWGLPEYAEFIGQFVQKTELKPYALMGHSNGGAISVLACAAGYVHPKKLILLASSGVRSATSSRKILHKIGAKTVKLLIVILPKSTQKKIKQRAYNKIGSDYMAIDGLQETFKKVVSYDVLADAKKINIPTLLVYGSNDFVTPIWQAEKISAAINNSKLEVVDEAEHFPHKDQPEAVKKLLKEFLK